MPKAPTPSEEEIAKLAEPRFWSAEERPWRERQAQKIRDRMNAYHAEWGAAFTKAENATLPKCFNFEHCGFDLKPGMQGLIYNGRLYCSSCRKKVWEELGGGKRLGLYP